VKDGKEVDEYVEEDVEVAEPDIEEEAESEEPDEDGIRTHPGSDRLKRTWSAVMPRGQQDVQYVCTLPPGRDIRCSMLTGGWRRLLGLSLAVAELEEATPAAEAGSEADVFVGYAGAGAGGVNGRRPCVRVLPLFRFLIPAGRLAFMTTDYVCFCPFFTVFLSFFGLLCRLASCSFSTLVFLPLSLCFPTTLVSRVDPLETPILLTLFSAPGRICNLSGSFGASEERYWPYSPVWRRPNPSGSVPPHRRSSWIALPRSCRSSLLVLTKQGVPRGVILKDDRPTICETSIYQRERRSRFPVSSTVRAATGANTLQDRVLRYPVRRLVARAVRTDREEAWLFLMVRMQVSGVASRWTSSELQEVVSSVKIGVF
jgi:hypothetical protein